MNTRPRGLLSRLAAGLVRLLFGGSPEAEVVEELPPPSIPTEPPPPPEGVYVPPSPTLPPEPLDLGGEDEAKDVYYIPQHYSGYTSRSRTGNIYQGTMRVLPRWQVGGTGQHVELRDVKALLDKIGYKNRYVIIITGVPEYEYPGKEGENVISLSFPLYGPDVWNSLDFEMGQYDPETDEEYGSAEGWINDALQGYQPIPGQDYQWADIQRIDILDQY